MIALEYNIVLLKVARYAVTQTFG